LGLGLNETQNFCVLKIRVCIIGSMWLTQIERIYTQTIYTF
jgi:hypothetical protein